MSNTNKGLSALTAARIDDEITLDEYLVAQHIQFNINDEDVPLFIQSIRELLHYSNPPEPNAAVGYLRNISCVEYAHADDDIYDVYSGAYVVAFKDGTQSKLGWKDSDRLAIVYPID